MPLGYRRPTRFFGPLRRTLISPPIPTTPPNRSSRPSSSLLQSASCSNPSLPGRLAHALSASASFSASSPVPGRPNSSRSCRIPRARSVEPSAASQIVDLIRGGDSDDLESKLRLLNPSPSHALVSEVLRASTDRGIPAFRFFCWVADSYPDFRYSSDAFNLMICNLGCFDDYDAMHRMFNELSSKGHCLTEKAFSFLGVRTAAGIRDSVRKLAEILNKVGGSCRGSGIFSLIKFLCSVSSFDLAISLMAETARKTSYYNVLIAAKCRSLDFEGARDMFDEMRRTGFDPDIKSYNYFLGSLFKDKRFVEACDVLQAMEDLGYRPDSATFEVVLVHACKAKRMNFAIEFFDKMLSEGFKPNIAIHAAFIKGYFWSGRVEDAYRYAVDMSMKDKYSVNINFSLLAKLCCMSGRIEEAGRVLHELMDKGLKPNFPVYMRVMKDLYKSSRGDLASELKTKFQQFDLHADVR